MSWAVEMADSPEHIRSLIEASKEHIGLLETRLARRTGTQSASGGPAKPLLVGSTPTPCSKITVKPEDVDPKDGNYGPWLRAGKK